MLLLLHDVETPPTCWERKPLGLFHKGSIEYALASSPPPPSHQTQSEKNTNKKTLQDTEHHVFGLMQDRRNIRDV